MNWLRNRLRGWLAGSPGAGSSIEDRLKLLQQEALRIRLEKARAEGGGDATPDLATLPGKRFVHATEPAIGGKMSPEVIRALTGKDSLAAPVRPGVRGWLRRRLIAFLYPDGVPLGEVDQVSLRRIANSLDRIEARLREQVRVDLFAKGGRRA